MSSLKIIDFLFTNKLVTQKYKRSGYSVNDFVIFLDALSNNITLPKTFVENT